MILMKVWYVLQNLGASCFLSYTLKMTCEWRNDEVGQSHRILNPEVKSKMISSMSCCKLQEMQSTADNP